MTDPNLTTPEAVTRMLERLDAEDIPQRPAWQRDQEFIAWAREAVPALAARVAELEAARDGWRLGFHKAEAQLAALDRMLQEAEQRGREKITVKDAAKVLLDWWENVDQDDPSVEQAIGVVQIMGDTQEEVDRWHNALRALIQEPPR